MPRRPRAEGAEHTSPGQSREAGAALGSSREILGRPARAVANGCSSGRCRRRWRHRITLPRMARGAWAAPFGIHSFRRPNPTLKRWLLPRVPTGQYRPCSGPYAVQQTRRYPQFSGAHGVESPQDVQAMELIRKAAEKLRHAAEVK
jgi:hypothetical protein